MSSLIRAEWWGVPKTGKMYERMPQPSGFFFCCFIQRHCFVQYIMFLIQKMLICDIHLTFLKLFLNINIDGLSGVCNCMYILPYYINEGKDLSTVFLRGWYIASGQGIVCSANIQSIDGSIKHVNILCLICRAWGDTAWEQ